MPHVIVKMHDGRTEEMKARLAEQIAKDVVSVLGVAADAVSVSIQEVTAQDWPEKVYRPDILNCPGKMYKEPGYNPFG
jgi:4-oxalocrotonate tautomerase